MVACLAIIRVLCLQFYIAVDHAFDRNGSEIFCSEILTNTLQQITGHMIDELFFTCLG